MLRLIERTDVDTNELRTQDRYWIYSDGQCCAQNVKLIDPQEWIFAVDSSSVLPDGPGRRRQAG